MKNIKHLGRLSTGGGFTVEVVLNELKNKALLIDNEGYSIIKLKSYEDFIKDIEENIEEIEEICEMKIKTDVDEHLAWVLLDVSTEKIELKTIEYIQTVTEDMIYGEEEKFYESLSYPDRMKVVEEILN